MDRGSFIFRPYPRNYILRYPLKGTLVLFVFILLFTVLYRPLNTHEAYSLGFEMTMLVYSLGASTTAFLAIHSLKKSRFFGITASWTLAQELLSIIIVISTMGIVVFFMAFVVEGPGGTSRWNLATFWDSFWRTGLMAFVPFLYFTSFNLKELFGNINPGPGEKHQNEFRREINISSKLKKESLHFYEDEFLFAESEGNYVIFNLFRNGKVLKIPIRNSISDVDHQLSGVSAFFRCHRAFIVNVSQVAQKRGNSLGYQLRLTSSGDQVPVSRRNIKQFDRLMDEFQSSC